MAVATRRASAPARAPSSAATGTVFCVLLALSTAAAVPEGFRRARREQALPRPEHGGGEDPHRVRRDGVRGIVRDALRRLERARGVAVGPPLPHLRRAELPPRRGVPVHGLGDVQLPEPIQAREHGALRLPPLRHASPARRLPSRASSSPASPSRSPPGVSSPPKARRSSATFSTGWQRCWRRRLSGLASAAAPLALQQFGRTSTAMTIEMALAAIPCLLLADGSFDLSALYRGWTPWTLAPVTSSALGGIFADRAEAPRGRRGGFAIGPAHENRQATQSGRGWREGISWAWRWSSRARGRTRRFPPGRRRREKRKRGREQTTTRFERRRRAPTSRRRDESSTSRILYS